MWYNYSRQNSEKEYEMTNYERIKNMSVDELTEFLYKVNLSYAENCMVGKTDCKQSDYNCAKCFTEYLMSESDNL